MRGQVLLLAVQVEQLLSGLINALAKTLCQRGSRKIAKAEKGKLYISLSSWIKENISQLNKTEKVSGCLKN